MESIASIVQQRADALMTHDSGVDLPEEFLEQCLYQNEWGSALMYAAKFRGQFLFNVSVEKGVAWMAWDGIIWRLDYYRFAMRAVELCALEFDTRVDSINRTIDDLVDVYPDVQKKDDSKDSPALVAKRREYNALINQRKECLARAKTLRTANGMKKVLELAPLADCTMACREEDLNLQDELLPAKNCVIDLRTGAALRGNPADLMSKAVDVEYDAQADCTDFAAFVREIFDNEEMYEFVHRSIGYAATGYSNEQYIWFFLGRARNGKGTFFGCISEVMGGFFHQINPSMLMEQKIDPSPNATSEHKFSLKNKRLVVGSEIKRGKAVAEDQVKTLTGDDKVVCRPNFSHEVIFNPSHTLMMQVNHMPRGIASDLAMQERLLEIDLPYSYVADVADAERKEPNLNGKFRLRDTSLKARLLANKPGILRWIVDGSRKYLDATDGGLKIPQQVRYNVEQRSKLEDYMGEFIADCLVSTDVPGTRLQVKHVHLALNWWWGHNRGSDERKMPTIQTVGEKLRDRDYSVVKKGGKTWCEQVMFHHEVAMEIATYINEREKRQ